jgi:hypothetical protein
MAKKFAWSYSALTGFETCPKQYRELKVTKSIREAPSAAMQAGSHAHKRMEERIRDKTELPENMRYMEKMCVAFDNAATIGADVLVEERACLNEDLAPTEFFARDAWLRGVFDVVVLRGRHASIYDWKTGKRKVDNDQLKLFAALAFELYEVDKIDTYFVWMKEKRVDKKTFIASDAPAIWQDFLPRVNHMADSYNKDKFPARPSGLCNGWCPVITCEHNSKYRGN